MFLHTQRTLDFL